MVVSKKLKPKTSKKKDFPTKYWQFRRSMKVAAEQQEALQKQKALNLSKRSKRKHLPADFLQTPPSPWEKSHRDSGLLINSLCSTPSSNHKKDPTILMKQTFQVPPPQKDLNSLVSNARLKTGVNQR